MVDYVANIKDSGFSIYDEISVNNEELFIPTETLEIILNKAMCGLNLSGLALRTRSKVVKTQVCFALGYPAPKIFAKVQPRFPGQNFDVYTQKSLNVQIWNEDIDLARRYVFLRVTDEDIITKVRVITGAQLVSYDRTGTLTHKYQATMNSQNESTLFSKIDTNNVISWTSEIDVSLNQISPSSLPCENQLLKIATIYEKLLPLTGTRINYLAAIQERNRGAELHRLICKQLGYSTYEDDGTYPDIKNQLLEVKLQTSPTIDLGLHYPNDCLEVVNAAGKIFKSEDIRYAIFNGKIEHDEVLLRFLYLVNGRDFSKYFPLFQGKTTNAKLQIPLPLNFFD